jgi:hypothetical protein
LGTEVCSDRIGFNIYPWKDEIRIDKLLLRVKDAMHMRRTDGLLAP